MARLAVALSAALILSMGTTAMSAQDSVYDQNALRVESTRGDLQIVRGAQGIVVAHSGIFHGPGLANLVTQSESALAEAKIFERDYQPGQYIAGLGIAMMGAAIGAAAGGESICTTVPNHVVSGQAHWASGHDCRTCEELG